MRFRLNATAILVAQAVSSMILAGCGGANEESTATAVAPTDVPEEGMLDETLRVEALRFRLRDIDFDAPAITITSVPTATSSASISVAGSASDNLRLYRVRWVNDRGGKGSARLSDS